MLVSAYMAYDALALSIGSDMCLHSLKLMLTLQITLLCADQSKTKFDAYMAEGKTLSTVVSGLVVFSFFVFSRMCACARVVSAPRICMASIPRLLRISQPRVSYTVSACDEFEPWTLQCFPVPCCAPNASELLCHQSGLSPRDVCVCNVAG